MWTLIVSFDIISFWSLALSIVLANGDSNRCCVSSNDTLDNVITIFSRLLIYVLWCLPIIYVLRPGVKCCGAQADDEGQEMAEFKESFLEGDIFNTSA
jgi:hypothetical protein